jgi:hypothetical protein
MKGVSPANAIDSGVCDEAGDLLRIPTPRIDLALKLVPHIVNTRGYVDS